MRVGDFQGTKVYRELPEQKRTRKDGTERGPKKLGKIHFPVFAPDGRRLVGFMVSPPDVLGMIKQPDRFVAFDALSVVEDRLVAPDRKDAYDAAAAKRLGVKLDDCLIWTGMDVVTASGEAMGYCADADCHPRTGAVITFSVTASSAASTLLGNVEVPVALLRGYRSGAMVVADEAQQIGYSGGAAAKAAEASVRVSTEVKKGAKVLDEHGSRAVDKGSRALGRQLGRAKGMFGAFADEYKKASGSSGAKKKA
ncbi:MAG: PRC-barrel domain containing protein [Coriobacteriaceae bacterium]|nr:PRC-barrel domain containing protein [Coriobacteriaceae bacterium]